MTNAAFVREAELGAHRVVRDRRRSPSCVLAEERLDDLGDLHAAFARDRDVDEERDEVARDARLLEERRGARIVDARDARRKRFTSTAFARPSLEATNRP